MPTLNSYKINIVMMKDSRLSVCQTRVQTYTKRTTKRRAQWKERTIFNVNSDKECVLGRRTNESLSLRHIDARQKKKKLSPTFINTVYTRRRKWRNLHGRHLDRYLAAIAGSRSSHDDRGRLSWVERKRERKRRNRERCLVPWLRFLIMKMSGRFFSGERMKVPKE